MRKVLNITLMTTLAIALLGLQTVAFGMAPVISGIPSPVIVGDAELTTPDANFFVFPDALNLANYVADESILPQDLAWTYAYQTGTPVYLINGVQPLDLATEDAQTPPSGKVINVPANVSPYEWNPDNNANTITIRNNDLTPLSAVVHVGDYPDPSATGTPPVPEGNFNGVLASQDRTVTLYCSDGTSLVPNFDQADVTIQTDNFTLGADGLRGTADDGSGGNDRVAGQPRSAAILRHLDFVNARPTGTSAWTSGDQVGATTFSTVNGLSIFAPVTGDNFGIWTSPENYIQLVSNSVWRLKMQVTSDQNTAYLVPLWDVIIENYTVAAGGPFGYGLDYFFLDNSGGANAAGSVGRTEFQIWYTPAAIQTTQFNNNITFNTLDTTNDMRVRFRVLDAGSAGVNANIDTGTLSLQNLDIERFDLGKITPALTTNVFNAATITDGSNGASVASDFTVSFIEGTVVDFTGGAVTLTPENTTVGWGGLGGAEVVMMQPGDNFFNPVTAFSIADNFPITWENDTLYRTKVNIASTGTTGQTNPPDVINIINDTPHNELTCISYVTPGLKDPAAPPAGLPVAMPRSAAADYQSFFYSHSASRTGISTLRTFRPLIQIISVQSLVLGGISQSTGGVKIASVKVDKVGFAD